MKLAMTRWLRGRTPRMVGVALVLALSVSASAAKLPVKTLEMLDDGTWREIVTGVGEKMYKDGGGQVVKRTITKVPGRVPWGGLLNWGPLLVKLALDEYSNRLYDAGSQNLKQYLRPDSNFPEAESSYTYGPDILYFREYACHGYDKDNNPVTAYLMGNPSGSRWVLRYTVRLRSGALSSSSYGTGLYSESLVRSQAALWCPGLKNQPKSLADVMRANPSDAALIGDAVRDYIKAHPDKSEVKNVFESPVPTINQYDMELIDPSIVSVPGSRYSDGDYLQEGIEPQSGNRKHPLDGGPLEPWKDAVKPLDTDDDGIPDWRDADDNGDGVPDIEQNETDQKARPGEPGYGRRQGDTSNKTTVTEEPIEGGTRRTVTTITTGPTGETIRKTVTDTVTEKTYQPGTPAVPATPPGPNGEPGTPGTPGKPGTIITNTTITTTTTTTTTNTTNNTTNTTTNTTTHTENKSEPGPTPQPGDDDGDGKPNEEDPHPNDPIPEQEEEKKGKDGPGGQPYFDQGNLPRWKSDPLTLAIQRNQRELADLKADRLPFAIGKLIPTLGGVGSSCPDVSVGAGGGLPAIQLVVCESAPAQWMHGAGRSLMAFVLTCIFLVAVVRTVANS